MSSQLPADMLLVMLGANDILAGASPEESAALMEEFLRECSLCDITAVIGEPGIHTGRRDDEKRLEEYGILLRDVCSRCGAYYIDTSVWDINMGSDGIHLDEASQEVFARELASFILKLQEE
ncbi:MAG: SGNH/GDSL hydrolase family protein [Anaerovoracaceae bacterium]